GRARRAHGVAAPKARRRLTAEEEANMAEEHGTHSHGHGHNHGHDHAHGHPHDRTFQPDIEDSPPGDSELLAEALRQILIEKGVLTADEIRAEVEKVDSVAPSLGGRIVARAWTDSAFKA